MILAQTYRILSFTKHSTFYPYFVLYSWPLFFANSIEIEYVYTFSFEHHRIVLKACSLKIQKAPTPITGVDSFYYRNGGLHHAAHSNVEKFGFYGIMIYLYLISSFVSINANENLVLLL